MDAAWSLRAVTERVSSPPSTSRSRFECHQSDRADDDRSPGRDDRCRVLHCVHSRQPPVVAGRAVNARDSLRTTRTSPDTTSTSSASTTGAAVPSLGKWACRVGSPVSGSSSTRQPLHRCHQLKRTARRRPAPTQLTAETGASSERPASRSHRSPQRYSSRNTPSRERPICPRFPATHIAVVPYSTETAACGRIRPTRSLAAPDTDGITSPISARTAVLTAVQNISGLDADNALTREGVHRPRYHADSRVRRLRPRFRCVASRDCRPTSDAIPAYTGNTAV